MLSRKNKPLHHKNIISSGISLHFSHCFCNFALMKKKYRLIVLFLAPLIVAIVVCECLLRSFPNSYKLKYERVCQLGDSVETLILGASHTYMGLNPLYFNERAFNLAHISQTYDYDYKLLEKFAPRLHPKTVITAVDNGILFDPPLETSEGWYLCTSYQLYMDCGDYSVLSKYNYEITSATNTFKKIEKHWNGEEVECDRSGWCITYKASLRDTAECSYDYSMRRIVKHTCKNWDYYKHNQQALFQLCDYCRQHDIRLILLITPTIPYYYQQIPPQQKEAILETLGYCHKYYGAEIGDYLEDKRFSDDDFYDCDHLSDIGAKKFSQMIAADFCL